MHNRSISRSLLHHAPLITLLLVAAACGPVRRGGGQPAAQIIFRNESLDQAAVYVVAPGLDFTRIGTVFPGGSDTLNVPAGIAGRGGTLNIVARLLARSELPQTGPISIRPGDRYEVRLPADARVLVVLPAGS